MQVVPQLLHQQAPRSRPSGAVLLLLQLLEVGSWQKLLLLLVLLGAAWAERQQDWQMLQYRTDHLVARVRGRGWLLHSSVGLLLSMSLLLRAC
jgi:hypothetical protein